MSLIYSRNSIESNVLPCGTSHIINFCSERMLPTFTTCCLLNKINSIKCFGEVATVYAIRVSNMNQNSSGAVDNIFGIW